MSSWLVLFALALAACGQSSDDFASVYKNEVEQRLRLHPNPPLLSEKDIAHLPGPLRKYLHFSGAVGRPVVANFRSKFSGSMRQNLEADWMDIQAAQYNFFGPPARLFFVRGGLFGLPFDGLHVYTGAAATMRVKVAGMFTVVDASGEKMNQGENVTLFNDMCLLAPATLVDPAIEWETIDPLTVRARFTHNGITIGARLFFDESGALINFDSEDRYLSTDGKTYAQYRWSTPVRDYGDFDGRKVFSYAEAIWHLPAGDFPYARFKLQEIEYNAREFRP